MGTDLSVVTAPLYSFAEADRLAAVSRGTSSRWLCDRGLTGESVRPPAGMQGADGSDAVSFLDLVEIAAIGRLKEFGFSLARIRGIVDTCRDLLGVERPLATMKFKVGGRDIFVDERPGLIEVGRRQGQRAWDEVLSPFLRDLDYADDVARRWWPLGRSNPIVVDPDYGYGLPVIAESGVRTEIILERFKAGDLPELIASDFNVTPHEVQRALQFELNRAA